jgi:hypothetical protein
MKYKLMSNTAMEFIESLDQRTSYMVKNMMKSIFALGESYVEFVRDFDSKSGFMFSCDKKMDNIMNNDLVRRDGHSGCSAAITMRNCQYMLGNFPINDIETGLYYDDYEPVEIHIPINCDYDIESPPLKA